MRKSERKVSADQPVRLLAGHALDELEHLRRRDAIELGAELERGSGLKNALCAISRIAVARCA